MTEGAPDDPLFDPERGELERLRVALAGSLRGRVVLWAIRWTAGFAVIGIVVYVQPALSWLCWVGAGIASVSLAVMLAVHRVSLGRMDTAEHRIDECERIARDIERQAPDQETD